MNLELNYEELRLLRLAVETEIIRREGLRGSDWRKLTTLRELGGRLSACIHDYPDVDRESGE